MVMKKRKKAVKAILTYGILIMALIVTVFPIYWMIKSSVTADSQMYVARPSIISTGFTLDNYKELFAETHFGTALKNSFLIAGITTIACLIISILGSYAMTRLEFPGRKIFKTSIIFSYLIPTAVLFIPMYVFVSGLGFYDNKYALLIIYPTTVVPYCCYMLMSYFKTIPYALEEAALIDGCSRIKSLLNVIVPIALPGIAVVSTFAFTMSWNEYLYAMIMTTSPVQQTAVVAISSFKYADSAIWGRIMSASVIASVPVAVIYIIAQSLLISGKSEGSVK